MAQPGANTIGKWMIEFLDGYEDTHFKKVGDHIITNEQALLKILKFFFLAKYPHVRPEISAYNGGRIDFGFGNLALEVVVRNKSGKGNLQLSQNRSEMMKLRRHHGKSCLALINMESGSSGYLKKLIKTYRQHSLGKGNHANAKPITVLAIAREGSRYGLSKHILRVP